MQSFLDATATAGLDKLILAMNAGNRRQLVFEKGFTAALQSAVQKSLTTEQVMTTGSNIAEINLDPAFKHLYPILTPFLNAGYAGEVGGQVGRFRTYRAFTEMNPQDDDGNAGEASTDPTITFSGRGRVFSQTSLDRQKNFAKIMPEAAVTREEADLSGVLDGFLQKQIVSMAIAKQLEEENLLFSTKGLLGPPTGLVATAFASGGTLATGSYVVKVTALTYWGIKNWQRNAAAGTFVPLGAPLAVANARNAESNAVVSGAVAVTGPTGRIDATVTTLKGAFAYAWYLTFGGADYLVGLTGAPAFSYTSLNFQTFPVITITAATLVPTVDQTDHGVRGSTILYEGLYQQIVLDADVPIRGPYLDMNAGTFTPQAGGTGLKEWDNILGQLFRAPIGVSPTAVLVSAADWSGISANLLSQAAQPYRLQIETEDGTRVSAGTIIETVKNNFARSVFDVVVHPLMPSGKVIFYTRDLPYEANNTGVNLSHFFNHRYRQVFFPNNADYAPPGPWGISTLGQPILTWPKACAVIEGFKVS